MTLSYIVGRCYLLYSKDVKYSYSFSQTRISQLGPILRNVTLDGYCLHVFYFRARIFFRTSVFQICRFISFLIRLESNRIELNSVKAHCSFNIPLVARTLAKSIQNGVAELFCDGSVLETLLFFSSGIRGYLYKYYEHIFITNI